jgi:hypothetical protein
LGVPVSRIFVCAKCGSEKIVTRASVIGHQNAAGVVAIRLDENPDALIFREAFVCDARARVCGERGYVELYAEQPGELYAAHERANQKRA